MKVMNLLTGIVFDLPKSDVETLLKTSPNTFAKVTKNKKIVKQKKNIQNDNSVLGQILEE